RRSPSSCSRAARLRKTNPQGRVPSSAQSRRETPAKSSRHLSRSRHQAPEHAARTVRSEGAPRYRPTSVQGRGRGWKRRVPTEGLRWVETSAPPPAVELTCSGPHSTWRRAPRRLSLHPPQRNRTSRICSLSLSLRFRRRSPALSYADMLLVATGSLFACFDFTRAAEEAPSSDNP